LVDERGHARLVDFGLARLEGGGQLTRTGSQVGSLHYMAPEQLLERSAELDGRVDVYALGVTLYELLTRSSPFAGFPPEETIRRIREGLVINPRRIAPHLSRDVEAVLLQAMAVDRDRRYASASDFARELECLLALRPVVARRPTATVRLRAWMRRRPRLATASLLGVLTALVVWGVVEWQQAASSRSLAEESTRTEAQTAALGELLTELGYMLDEAILSQDGSRLARIQSRLAAVEERAAALPEAGDGDPLEVANARLTMALTSVQKGDYERTVGHMAAARAALDEHGSEAALPLVFRAHTLLSILARKLDDPELRLASWSASLESLQQLESLGRLSHEDRLQFLHEAVDEGAFARVSGDFVRAIEIRDLLRELLPREPSSRAERLAVGRVMIESTWLALVMYELDRARDDVERAADALEGLVADTPAMRAALCGLGRVEAEVFLASGQTDRAVERLDDAARFVDSRPTGRSEHEVLLRFLDLRLRLADAQGDRAKATSLVPQIEAAAHGLLERFGRFGHARALALLSLSNLVSLSSTPDRLEETLELGRRGLNAWSALASPDESALIYAQMLLNLGALEQDSGDFEAAAADYAEADRVLVVARSHGRSDHWLDRTQLGVLANQGVLHSIHGDPDAAIRSLTRAQDMSRLIAQQTDSHSDWWRHARISQELANVHMDTERNAHSIEVLEDSIAELDALDERGRLSDQIASERDWQCYSLMTQYLQRAEEPRVHALLRTLLERPAEDPGLAIQLALAAAYAIRVDHPEADADRDLCRAWIDRATALEPSFLESLDSSVEPWDRVAIDE
ncbi:MAG: serine/threonine-protein kinase, partial [Planctomycetota bacterium]